MNGSTQTGQADRRRIREEAAAWYAKMKSPRCDPAIRDQFEQWLARNPLHELAYEQCRTLWEMAASLREDTDIRREIAGARGAAGRMGKMRIPASPYLQVAAALVIVVGFLFAVLNPSADIYSTRIGEHRLVRLDDGSTATLNTDTVIAVSYSGDSRRIELRKGEAFFVVAKDRRRPFEVQAAGSIVRALGTEFNVMLLSRTLSVAVTEGVVELLAQQRQAAQSGVQIKRGEALTYYENHRVSDIEPANLERISAWRNRKIYFDSNRLVDAVTEYNRYTHTPLKLLDKDLEDEPISGIFNVGDLSSFIFSLEQILDVRVVREKNHIYIMSKKRGPNGVRAAAES